MNRSLPIVLLFALSLQCVSVFADDLAYVADEELVEELAARESDIQRTSERINELNGRVSSLENEAAGIRTELDQIKQRLTSKASLLYRLSRNGKAVRYLFSAGSGTAFLKRMQTLKKLVTSDMEKIRKAGVRLEDTEAALTSAKQEVSGAMAMLSELETIRDDILIEKQRRETELLAAN